jgi:CheY-like chemotaxis protein
MPIMNGIECLAQLKKMPLTKDIPVYMLSTAFEQAELSKKVGAKGFIRKSGDIHELQTQLDCIFNLDISINYVQQVKRVLVNVLHLVKPKGV